MIIWNIIHSSFNDLEKILKAITNFFAITTNVKELCDDRCSNNK